jgi:1,4-dihydroxy-2-naphthoyl-CoA hydrolase
MVHLMNAPETVRPPDLDNPSPFLAAAGLRFTSVSPTLVVGTIDLGASHHTPWGVVHGGVYATAVESAASVGASAAAADHGQIALGVANTTNFLRSMAAGRVTVTATPVHQGRTQQLWQVDITDETDRLVAIGQVRLQNVEPRAPISGSRTPP